MRISLHRLMLWAITLIATHTLVSNILVGSTRWLISCAAIVFPLIGGLVALPTTSLVCLGLYVAKGLFGVIPVTLGIPTLCATLSWAVSKNSETLLERLADIVINLVLPLTSIAIFITHPVGRDAALYSFYWLIPPALWLVRTCTKTSAAYIVALQSTFVAHAAGSILWLYSVTMTAAQWNALIPLVAVERLSMACIGTLAYYTICCIAQKYTSAHQTANYRC